MMLHTVYERYLLAQAKLEEYERQAELERLFKDAGTPSLRIQLAQILQSLAVRLAPELSHPQLTRSLKTP
jgi:hypothetical protein